MDRSQVKSQNPLPWGVKPSGVVPANHRAAMSCRQPRAMPAPKCCRGFETIGLRKASAVAKAMAEAMVAVVEAVDPKVHGATQMERKHHAHRAPEARKVKAKVGFAAPYATANPWVTHSRAAMRDVLPAVAWANSAHLALLPADNRIPCVPVSI